MATAAGTAVLVIEPVMFTDIIIREIYHVPPSLVQRASIDIGDGPGAIDGEIIPLRSIENDLDSSSRMTSQASTVLARIMDPSRSIFVQYPVRLGRCGQVHNPVATVTISLGFTGIMTPGTFRKDAGMHEFRGRADTDISMTDGAVIVHIELPMR